MRFELDDAVYESFLQLVQFEVTGNCNMHCKHCRAAEEARKNLTMDEINKVMDFIVKNKEDNFRLTLSGGEPFIHPQIVDIVKLAKNSGIEEIIITSNGYLITDELLQQLNDLKLKNFTIQISLDSIFAEKHDEFRGFKGAFDKAIEVLKKINDYDNIYSSIRMTATHDTLNEVPAMIDMAKEIGVRRIGLGTVIPAGSGADGKLTLSKEEKKKFLEMLAEKHNQYEGVLDVTTEDPLKFNVKNSPWAFCKEGCQVDKGFFGGCTAGITTFNVSADGTITPCSLLPIPILNIHDFNNSEDMLKEYQDSKVIKDFLTREFKGKCGECKMKRICGGCRATAMGFTGDYMESDPTCWSI